MTAKLYGRLLNSGIDCRRDIDLSEYSSLKVGGIGELCVFPKSTAELALCLSEITASGLEYHIIGNGSNILFLDGRLSGVFLFTEGLRKMSIEGNIIRAEAGVLLSALAAKAADASLCGLEFARGIPGSLGGGVFMNAGAYDGQLSDVVVSTLCYDAESGKTRILTDHSFSYRSSIYEMNTKLVCLSAELKLSEGNRDEIYARMRELSEARRQKQPLEFPSAGSYFKRPEGHFAGKLIEDAGLKGLSVGGAAVSEKHAGFIINRGGARASDILELEAKVIETVYEKFGIRLEREVRVIG